MSFHVTGDAYDRFIGRYSGALAATMVDFCGITRGWDVLDVGCGPGALTGALVAAVGPQHVFAIDPSESFVAACRSRIPDADVRQGSAEHLPWKDASFDAAAAQLVLSFLRDPRGGVREMRRVVREDGIVAASTFDANGFQLLQTFWDAARELDPAVLDDAALPFRRMPELVDLWEATGLREVVARRFVISADYKDFDDCWQPFLGGVGPAGDYCRALSSEHLSALRERYLLRLGQPKGSFTLPAVVLAVRGRV